MTNIARASESAFAACHLKSDAEPTDAWLLRGRKMGNSRLTRVHTRRCTLPEEAPAAPEGANK